MTQSWMSTVDLGLPVVLQREWEGYILEFNSSGIQLSRAKDTLVWSWNGKNCEINAKLVMIICFMI